MISVADPLVIQSVVITQEDLGPARPVRIAAQGLTPVP